MKIQLANRTYHRDDRCCGTCPFYNLVRISTWEVQWGCVLSLKCHNGFKKQLFNDKVFKL